MVTRGNNTSPTSCAGFVRFKLSGSPGAPRSLAMDKDGMLGVRSQLRRAQGTNLCLARHQDLLPCHSNSRRNQEEQLSSSVVLAGQLLVTRRRGEVSRSSCSGGTNHSSVLSWGFGSQKCSP